MTGRSALAGPHRTLPELQDALFIDLGDVPRKMFRFWVLLVLSAIIATAGILANSTAIVTNSSGERPASSPRPRFDNWHHPARETGAAPSIVTTGTPIHKLSRLVVWPL